MIAMREHAQVELKTKKNNYATSIALNEIVQYVDVTLLYPYANCNYPYLLGDPRIIHSDFNSPQSYFGFIKAKVYPPRKFYYAVLLYKTPSEKLVFTLCTCTELKFQGGPCTPNDDERDLMGMWVTPEFTAALTRAYKVSDL